MMLFQQLFAAIASFERNSPGWQLQQFRQRTDEWLEGIFAPIGRISPIWGPPEWLVRLLFWIIAILLILWLGWQLYQFLSPYFYPTLAIELSGEEPNNLVDRSVTTSQWLQRSRHFARQGNYREACRYLYQATLQQLDERKIVPQQQSRTDGEYRSLLLPFPNNGPYQVLLDIHERLCFSNTEISAAEFEQCQQAYRALWNEPGKP